jgi:hypothetical protein
VSGRHRGSITSGFGDTRDPDTHENLLDNFTDVALRSMPPMGMDGVEGVWNHYARDPARTDFGSRDVHLLCNHLVRRLCTLIENNVKRQHPNISAAQLEKFKKKEEMHLLPGGHQNKNEADINTNMRKHFLKAVNLSKTGRITKMEFSQNWNSMAEILFKEEQGNNLQCQIQ